MAELFYWPKIREYLDDRPNAGPEGIDHASIFDFGNLSPLTEEMSKIPMFGQFNRERLIENICRDFVDQNLKLTYGTWCKLRIFFDAVANRADRSDQILEILFVVSKASADELYSYYNPPTSASSRKWDRNERYERSAFAPLLSSITDILSRPSNSAKLMDQETSIVIKNFLRSRPISDALRDALNYVDLFKGAGRHANLFY